MIDTNIELDELRLEENDVSRDNIEAVRRSLEKIQLILNDIDQRLKALE